VEFYTNSRFHEALFEPQQHDATFGAVKAPLPAVPSNNEVGTWPRSDTSGAVRTFKDVAEATGERISNLASQVELVKTASCGNIGTPLAPQKAHAALGAICGSSTSLEDWGPTTSPILSKPQDWKRGRVGQHESHIHPGSPGSKSPRTSIPKSIPKSPGCLPKDRASPAANTPNGGNHAWFDIDKAEEFLQQALACPFSKMNPSRYPRCSLGFARIRDVKQHLRRKHAKSTHSHRCGEAHGAKECADVNHAGIEGISCDQMRDLKKYSKRNAHPKDQWFVVWKTVFPELPQPRSPYVNSDLFGGICAIGEFGSSYGVADMLWESPVSPSVVVSSVQSPDGHQRAMLHGPNTICRVLLSQELLIGGEASSTWYGEPSWSGSNLATTAVSRLVVRNPLTIQENFGLISESDAFNPVPLDIGGMMISAPGPIHPMMDGQVGSFGSWDGVEYSEFLEGWPL
jgi:hypothetical protein